MKRLIFATLFISTFSYGAGECNDISNSAEIGLCAEYKKNEADDYMNKQYSSLMAKINAEYVNDVGLKNELIVNVKSSQRNWIKFRDANCKLYSFQIDSNSPVHQTIINECIARMSESRGKELAALSDEI